MICLAIQWNILNKPFLLSKKYILLYFYGQSFDRIFFYSLYSCGKFKMFLVSSILYLAKYWPYDRRHSKKIFFLFLHSHNSHPLSRLIYWLRFFLKSFDFWHHFRMLLLFGPSKMSHFFQGATSFSETPSRAAIPSFSFLVNHILFFKSFYHLI